VLALVRRSSPARGPAAGARGDAVVAFAFYVGFGAGVVTMWLLCLLVEVLSR